MYLTVRHGEVGYCGLPDGGARVIPCPFYVQAEGARDAQAVRHLDAADRIASGRVRHDPIARDLVLILDRRAPRRL